MKTALIVLLGATTLALLSGCCCVKPRCCRVERVCAPAQAALPDGPYAKDRSQSAWAYLTGKYDADRDGKISAAELGRGERAFQNLDRNGDGFATQDELGPGPVHGFMVRMIAMQWFQDDDDPSVMSRAEFGRGFDAIDSNGSGALTSKELNARIDTVEPSVKGMPTPPAGMDPFLSLKLLGDKDGDGGLSKPEALALFDASARDGVWALPKRKGARPVPGAARPVAGAAVGSMAPDFTLGSPDGQTHVTLSSFRGKRPVALIFGSYT
jgi:hypothetical protein